MPYRAIAPALGRLAALCPSLTLPLRWTATSTSSASTGKRGRKKADPSAASGTSTSPAAVESAEDVAAATFSIQVLESRPDNSFLCLLKPTASSAALSQFFSKGVGTDAITTDPKTPADTSSGSQAGTSGGSGLATSRHTSGRKSSSNVRNAVKNIKPIAPRTSYNLFYMERRAEVHKANPDMSTNDVHVHLGKLWRSLTHAEQASYKDMAAEDRRRYEEATKKQSQGKRLSDSDIGLDVTPAAVNQALKR